MGCIGINRTLSQHGIPDHAMRRDENVMVANSDARALVCSVIHTHIPSNRDCIGAISNASKFIWNSTQTISAAVVHEKVTSR